MQYASLTDIITREWSGMSTKQYKQFKGLKKESLRDNMTNMEIALNMLAEASATELSKQRNPQGLNQQKRVAKTAFYKNLEVNVRMKQRFVDDVPSDVLISSSHLSLRSAVFSSVTPFFFVRLVMT